MRWREWILEFFPEYYAQVLSRQNLSIELAKQGNELSLQRANVREYEDLAKKQQQALNDMRAQLEEAGAARIRLEDEARIHEQQMAEKDADLKATRRELIEAHQKFTDFLAVTSTRRAVFAQQAPSETQPIDNRPVNPTGKVRAAEVVQRATVVSMAQDTARQAERKAAFEAEMEEQRKRAQAEAEKQAG